MKSVAIIFLALVIATTQGHDTIKCEQKYLTDLKPITLNNFLGTWYIIRATPCKDEDHDQTSSCYTQTLWKVKDTPDTHVNSICSYRANNTLHFKQGLGIVHPLPTTGLVENQWHFEFNNKTVDSVFVDSDNGQTWVIEHTCYEEEKEPTSITTSMWVVMSRTQTMDAKLEQTLVEKIEKYSGLTQDKLRGIRQTDCYEVTN